MRNGKNGHIHEYVCALVLTAFKEDVSLENIQDNLEDAWSDGLQYRGKYCDLYLGTSLKTYSQYFQDYFAGKVYDETIDRALDFWVHEFDLKADYDEVYADGGTGVKSDVTLRYKHRDVLYLSLKWKTKSTFNQQTPGFKSMSNWTLFDPSLAEPAKEFGTQVSDLMGAGGDEPEREYKYAMDVFFEYLDDSFADMDPDNFVRAARKALTDGQSNTILVNLTPKDAEVYRFDARSQQALRRKLSKGSWEVEETHYNNDKSAVRTYTHTSGVGFKVDYNTRVRTKGGDTREIVGHNARWTFINI